MSYTAAIRTKTRIPRKSVVIASRIGLVAGVVYVMARGLIAIGHDIRPFIIQMLGGCQ